MTAMNTIGEQAWRCDVTGNPVGTDTRMIGAPPCACQGCRAADTIDALVEALDASRIAIDDWLHLFAPEHCHAERVAEANARIWEGGTLWYIAVTQERNRTALSLARKGGKTDDRS